jgi:hypothetical protein
MSSDTPPSDEESPPDATTNDSTGSDSPVFDRETLSDLLVNAVPIGIILAFVLMFGLASPGESGDPLVLFHAALVVGVVAVSYVSARVIAATGAPLTGSAATPGDAEETADED